MEKEILIKLLSDVGYPILLAVLLGLFVFIAFKFILLDVLDTIKRIHNIIYLVESKVKGISNDIAVLDVLVSTALDVKPDFLKLTNKLDENK